MDVENLCLEVLVSLIFITSKISSNNCCWLVWLKVFLKKGKKIVFSHCIEIVLK